MSEDKPLMLTNPKEIEFTDKSKEAVDIITKQIRNQKESIVKMKLKEIGKLNILKQMNRRFTPMMIVMNGSKEEVWIDNKTHTGLKLVTFYQIEEPTIDGNEFKTRLFYY